MQQDLVSLAETASGGRSLAKIFMDHQKYFTVESNNAAQLVANAAKNIERLLKKRSRALEVRSCLACSAENLQMQHQWKDDFAVRFSLDVNETEGKKNRIRPDFKEDPSFKRLTSYNLSAVHIPTDIYDGSTIVLNELNWTEALEDVFKKNREDDPTLLWQVFGSATGLARYYPASPWMDSRKTPSKIDLYDVRRRPWYIQGAASPKDMLILVDASGSVSGLTLKLIRTSVSEMLETLSDDDYVNVVVNNTACFDHLVQANVRNKKILKDAVQNITAKGITNYTKGFEFAFQQLSNPNITRANCNKIIMLFTDGGEERAQEVFEMYNPDKKVRIFTFSVGQHNYDTGPIQWMACEYLDVLGRPMVLADQQGKQVQWTNVYLDALELGLVITGTLPVFNKTRSREDGSQNQNQLILGVMGIDVSLDDIKRLTPRFTIGPNGYYFAIDPNGYVLLHPNLQPKNPKFQEPVTLDFLDAELENDIKVQIRTMMIDGDPGEKTIETLVKSQDERYIDRGVRTYTWKPVNGTDYRYNKLLLWEGDCQHRRLIKLIWIVKMEIFFLSGFSETMQVDKFEEFGFTFIAPREYCKDLRLSENNTRFLVDFNEYIDRRTPNDPMCNATLVNRLLLDAGLTADLLKLWKEQNVEGVQARFVATDGGITRVYPKSAGEIWSENPETYESSFYKRSLDNDIYIFTAPYVNKSIDTSYESGVLVSKAVNLNIDGVVLKPAGELHSILFSLLQHVDCVILDDGGFLLMSNQDKYIVQIGRFFGEVDPVLMISLVNTSLYSFNKTYDYQSVCDPEKESKTAAGPRCVYVLLSSLLRSLLQQLLLSLTFPRVLDAGECAQDTFSKESCITEQTQYFFENENRSFHGTLDCGNCSRMYRAEKLPSTNLVFLISDAKDTCGSCKQTALRQAEQPSSGPDLCELAQNPRYRKGPDVCFDNNAAVSDEPLCPISGSSALAAPSRLILFHVVFAVLWSV
uniref:VWFA domain-containing protein n=1 Tax=Denticeps clupeoides TaxID=299321 RepID=A0AAY4CY94_9TELE